MKKDIHPKYYKDITVHCVCGNKFRISSTKEFIETEACFKCHPFYTGKKKIMDVAGRVEKFRKKLELAKKLKKTKK